MRSDHARVIRHLSSDPSLLDPLDRVSALVRRLLSEDIPKTGPLLLAAMRLADRYLERVPPGEPPPPVPHRFSVDLDAVLPNGWRLFSHQKHGVAWCLATVERNPGLRGAILADDMGLGKTIQATLVASAFALKTFIIAPPSTHPDWMAMANMMDLDV